MRIALTTYALHIGGLETFVLSLAGGLVRAGHEVHIIATDERGAWFGRTRQVGAQAHFIDGVTRESRVAHARAVGQFLAAMGFDVVINNASWFVQASFGMLPVRTSTVSVIHNSAESVIALSCANPSACDAFVAPSPATFDLARLRVPDPGKVHLIRHGVEVLSIPPGPRDGDALAVVFCGRLEQAQKGVLLLPSVIRQVSDSGVGIGLEIIGDGPDREALTQLIHEVGVSRHVQVLGPLSHGESLERIREADALILPSFFEGLPFVPLEAMAGGSIPVLSSLPGVTDWIVRDGVSGFLVAPGDTEGFAEALLRLGRDMELRRRMSLAAWEAARECFALTTMVDTYLTLLRGLQGQPRTRKDLPSLAPNMIDWKDWIPHPLRRRLGGLRRLA